MSLKKQITDNLAALASFAAIMPMMFFLFATQSDLDAVAETVNLIQCRDAKSKLNDYQAAILMSGREPSKPMKDAIINLQIVIAKTCPK